MQHLLPFFLVVYSIFSQTHATERGYLLMSPRVLKQQASNELLLHLFKVNGPGEINIRLLKTVNDTEYLNKDIKVEAGSDMVFINLDVPPIPDYEGLLSLKGKFMEDDGEAYEIAGEERVTFRSSRSQFTFIQTDKPIYKPGQKVLFRVLLIDGSLRPLGGNMQANIWIEEPSSARVAQFNNVSLGSGIIQRDFQLSGEPNTGIWRIVVAFSDGLQEIANFEVKEYVLPKFEVVIKPPPFVLVTAEKIPLEICGKYTYGKLVEGTIQLKVSLEKYSWSYDKFPTIQTEDKINGCYKYEVDVSEIDEEFRNSYRRISVFAAVIENSTGISQNSSIFIDRLHNPLKIKFDPQNDRQFFKPGLTYFRKIKVTHPDDTPAFNELIEVCATMSRERILGEWWATRKVKYCRNYTSDEQGIFSFSVPPQTTDVVRYSLEAKSMNYTESSSNSPNPKPTLYQPQTATYLRPWYSPSGSFIQIQSIKKPLSCGVETDIQFFYTAKEEGEFKFFYEVVSSGKVLQSGHLTTVFNKEEKVNTDCEDSIMLGAKKTQIVPSPSNIESEEEEEESVDNKNNCTSMQQARYLPMVGSVNVTVKITAETSPSFFFIVYSVRDDRETIADSQSFEVEKCFNNKVDIKFEDEVKQPGSKTILTLNSSPNSLCGIKVIDKSITLLDNSEQLTKDKIFDALQQYNNNNYYPINHCYGKTVQSGLERKLSTSTIYPPRPPRPYSSSAYEDSLTAFEMSGYLVISDLILLTRPCENRGMYEAGFGGGAVAMPSIAMDSMSDKGVYSASRVRAPAASYNKQTTRAGAAESSAEATKSVVDIRTYFPETWLFDLIQIGEEGTFSEKKTLPHTITEWLGSAVCINNETGLGLSSDTAHVKGFQAFFLSFSLPYSVVRGEKLPVTISVFNYLDKCLSISLQLEQSSGFTLLNDSSQESVCVCGGKSIGVKFLIEPTALGMLNLTAFARNTETNVCEDMETADVVARDGLTNQVLVEPEGFPFEKVKSVLFCPSDEEDKVFKTKFTLEKPDDAVPESERAYISTSGDIMGPTIQNLDRLVQLPTGCGEQNMVTFTPIIFVLNYLISINQLTDSIKSKGIEYLQSGYQRELKYRRDDGSFSAFGSKDKNGSIWLTAFVLRSFAQAKDFITIDENVQKSAMSWILSKQNVDGSFPEIGATLSHGIKGGLNSSSSAMTAYILSSLIVAGVQDKNVTESALAYIASDDSVIDAFTASLFAYTFALADEPAAARDYLRKSQSKAQIKDSETQWPDKNSFINSVSLETAAYNLLTLLKLDEINENSLSIVRGITKNKNSRGGFSSTQDTILGLQALSEFASHLNKGDVNLEISISGDTNEKLTFTEEDKLLVKRIKSSEVPSEIEIEATGTGCGLIQTSVLCNTFGPQNQESFDLEVKAERTNDCRSVDIKVCTNYLPENKKSNMALVEVKMVSGIVADPESIDKLLNEDHLKMKRYEVNNNNVVFYFDEISNQQTCFNFKGTELVKVVDIKPATSKVYDYYSPDKIKETSYKIEENCK